MCGIAGILGRSRVNPAALRTMTDLMAHRGPDGDGIWQSADGRAALGHRRLAVIDLSPRGAQPMESADGQLCITYNGEIYNYRELKDELAGMGHRFRSSCDTEVVIEAYRAWGAACVERFNGMFAFAIVDRQRNEMFCARDRFGEKPFLFVQQDDWFAFASEYKALLALDGVTPTVDEAKLVRFLRRPADGLDHNRETVLRGIQQILPAERLTLDMASLSYRVERYWQPPMALAAPALGAEAAAERFRHLLTDAVSIRLRSDVAVGSCLSGGLDSSAIVCLSRDALGDRDYHVFTGRFANTPADEGGWADQVVKATGAVQHQVTPDPAAFLDEIDDFLWFNELPVDSASQYAQWCVFRLAAETGVTVLLDGQGADEILGGYEQYFAAYLASRRRDRVDTAAEEAAIRARYPLALATADQAWKHRIPAPLRRVAAGLLNRGSDLALGLTPDMARYTATAPLTAAPESLHAALRRDACGGFLTTLLRYGDRNSMAHSREVRLPFCDHRIAEFALTQPAATLMGDAQTKRLLRQAMAGILPEPIRSRWNKQGFLPPQADWFRAGLLEPARQVFGSSAFRTGGVWNAAWWERLARRFEAGEDGLAVALWKPFIAERWRDAFVARAGRLPRVAPLAGGSG